MSASTLRQHPSFLVLTVVTIIALLNLIIYVQPTKALTGLEVLFVIGAVAGIIGLIIGAISYYKQTKKDLEQKIKDAKAVKAKHEGEIQTIEAEIRTLNEERSKLDTERKSKYATIHRCDKIITAYNENTSPSSRARMQDQYDMAVADKKEAKKAIEKLDLRIDHYDLAIAIEKKKLVKPKKDLSKAQTKLTGLETKQRINNGLLDDANRRLGIQQTKLRGLERLHKVHEHHVH